jgi:uncharacterized delta-60 repeat protein
LATGVVLLLASPAYAVPGDLDTTFGGGDGKVATNYTSDNDLGLSVAIQPDGKIVVAGRAGGAGGQFAVIRYNPDGTLDTTFSGDGKVATNFTRGDDWAAGVALQADGKIVVAGRAAGSNPMFALARYNADGTLDTTFDLDGRLRTDFSGGRDAGWDVAIQSDGKIVAAGYASGRGAGRWALARYNSDGTPDSSFDDDGRLTTNFTLNFDAATAVAVQPDGKIVAAGAASDDSFFALARYNIDGALDSTFEGDGTVITDFTSRGDFAWDLALQTDGKLVAVGLAGKTWGIARYDTNGVLDPTFNDDGKVRTDLTSNGDAASGVALQPDGKIVVAGGANDDRVFGLARYNVDGALDSTFSGDGKLTTNVTSGLDFAWEVALQADGKIVAAGGAAGRGGRFAVLRYLGT